jgi:GTP diphosphokinase / guanosine-3',5'-bis(diphosphate) 3'-diphosphatase
MENVIDINVEKTEILKRYRVLLRICASKIKPEDKILIRKAFDIALQAHRDMRRKSGEPYIYHPLAVAQICVAEIGLGATSVICALLHDVVEDKRDEYPIEYITGIFGEKVSKIVEGLTKIKQIFDSSSTKVTENGASHISIQAENFRKILVTLSDDVRVILIKLADRLHNMRTLDAMTDKAKQKKIASETTFLFAPLAHRLGLYAIKTELEDLSLKYTEPDIYKSILQRLKETENERVKFLNKFKAPIVKALKEQGIDFRIVARPKSISSIWEKMQKKEIPFDEIYDIYAIRIIVDTLPEDEKKICWNIYSIITDIYKPNPNRLRDWISIPKANGYQALHTTVMSHTGNWVEVQIRSSKMDDIAEKGFAAHWKYKENNQNESNLDKWLKRVSELLQNSDSNALDFLSDFKMNLFADEIFVFTPKGEMRTLPIDSTVLDFAYSIHSEIGNKCIAAKLNHQLVPLSQPLKSGDQVEIITSSKQTPTEEWLNYVKTARAKAIIKDFIREEKRKLIHEGKSRLYEYFKELKIDVNDNIIYNLRSYYKLNHAVDLYYNVATDKIGLKEIKTYYINKESKDWLSYVKRTFKKNKDIKNKTLAESIIENLKNKETILLLGDNVDRINYSFATCCNPIPGDDFIAFIAPNESIKIHRSSCPEAIQLMTKYADRVVTGKWTGKESIAFLAGIKIIGIDKVGILKDITRIISEELNVNMSQLNIKSNDGIFEGTIMLYIQDTRHLNDLMNNLKKVDGISKVFRINRID